MIKTSKGITTVSLTPGGIAGKAGLRRGDVVLSVNGEAVNDELDFRFYSAQPEVNVLVARNKKELIISMERTSGEDLGSLGISFRDRPIARCCNKCIFCFVDQMPPGLRKSLYVKDEDYRYSFSNGNYVTLSGAAPGQLGHIAELGLSPMYVSVHATDVNVRNRMLGNPRAFDIMEQLRFLEKNDVRFHTQIVICPGINDGRALVQTIRDLLSFKKGLLSIAVVPVGITRHRKIPLQPVTRTDAKAICKEVGALSDLDFKSTGKRRIFLADEFFIKAEKPVPSNSYYEDYPQIENGVGLIRQLLKDWQAIKKNINVQGSKKKIPKKSFRGKKYLVLTSESAFLYINSIIRKMGPMFPGVRIDVIAVVNTFFGESVTVAGLLTAHDIIKSTKPIARKYDAIFIPAVMFNIRGYTMDGYSMARIEKKVGARVEVVPDLKEIFNRLEKKIACKK